MALASASSGIERALTLAGTSARSTRPSTCSIKDLHAVAARVGGEHRGQARHIALAKAAVGHHDLKHLGLVVLLVELERHDLLRDDLVAAVRALEFALNAHKGIGQLRAGLGIDLAVQVPLGLFIGLGEHDDGGLAFHVLELHDAHGVTVFGHALGHARDHAGPPQRLALGNLLVDGAARRILNFVAGIDLREREVARLG